MTININDELEVAKFCYRFEKKYKLKDNVCTDEEINVFIDIINNTKNDKCVFAAWNSATQNMNTTYAIYYYVVDKMVEACNRNPESVPHISDEVCNKAKQEVDAETNQ